MPEVASTTAGRSGSGIGGVASGLEAAREVVSLAGLLEAAGDLDATLQLICSLAVEHIAGSEHAAVGLTERRGQLRVRAATGPVATTLDRLQQETGEGPSLDVLILREVIAADDLTLATRWPAFSAAAVAATGVRAVLCFRLVAATGTLGALSLYSTRAGAFADTAAREWGSLFAATAGIALAGSNAQHNLRLALESRETISVAVGILMAREGLCRQEAFDVLRRASQRMNMKLRDVAALVAEGKSLSNRRARVPPSPRPAHAG